jgi:hypothetical protein
VGECHRRSSPSCIASALAMQLEPAQQPPRSINLATPDFLVTNGTAGGGRSMKSGIGKVAASVDFGDAALRSSARHLCTTFAFRLYSLAIAAADAWGCRHASRTCALNCALCLRRVARLTTPSIVSTSFIADTMPANSQAIKMTSPRAYARPPTQIPMNERWRVARRPSRSRGVRDQNRMAATRHEVRPANPRHGHTPLFGRHVVSHDEAQAAMRSSGGEARQPLAQKHSRRGDRSLPQRLIRTTRTTIVGGSASALLESAGAE